MHVRLTAIARRMAIRAGFLVALVLAAGSAAAGTADKAHEVRIDAVAVAGAPAIKGPVRMEIWAHNDDSGLHKVGESEQASLRMQLQPGRYRVVAQHRDIRTVRDIRINDAGDVHKTVSLRAGEVGLELLHTIGGSVLRDGVAWRVHRYRKGNAAGKTLATRSEPTPTLLLSEGWYEVVATHGNRQVSHVIEVTAGQRYDYSLVID